MPARPRPVWHRGAWLLLCLGLWLAPHPAAAQFPGTRFSTGESPAVVTIDQERLFADSAFGRAVEAEVAQAVRALAEENRTLERELAQEEQDLTLRRGEVPAEEFRTLADAFGARVEEIRRTQEDRSRAIAAYRDAQRQRFFEAAVPVITEVVVASGAVAVLDNRAIILALDQIDITDRVLGRVDAAIGSDDVSAIASDATTPAAQPDDPSRPLADPALPSAPPPPPGASPPPGLDLPPGPRPQPRATPPTGGPPLDLPPPSLDD